MTTRKPAHWWDHFWHVTTGCHKCGPACDNCWATGFSWTKGHHPNPKISAPFAGLATDAHTWTGEIRCNEDQWGKLAKWKPGEIVFVAPTGDLALAPSKFIQGVYIAMEQYAHLTFVICTKRPGLLVEKAWNHGFGFNYLAKALPNVWHMTTIWDQISAEINISHLLNIRKASPRWPVLGISAEPLLGPVDLGSWVSARGDVHMRNSSPGDIWRTVVPGLDWVVCGGESGRGARPMHPAWARGLRDQCQAAGVPFFFKQWGNYVPYERRNSDWWYAQNEQITGHMSNHMRKSLLLDGDIAYENIGKKAAGRVLDGRTWDALPEVTA